MKLLSLILAFNLLYSSLHVCLGDMSCAQDIEVQVDKKEAKKRGCCKSKSKEEIPTDEKSSCKDGCACCFVVQVVIMDIDEPSDYIPDISQQQKTWITDHYSHDFTHLVWHPPQV